MSESREQKSAQRWPEGLVLRGRWRIVGAQALCDALSLLTVEDLESERGLRLAVARVGVWSEGEVAALLQEEGPWHAPVLDAIRTVDTLILVSSVSPTLPALSAVEGLSREQRGMILADVADAAAEDERGRWTWTHVDLLRVDVRGGGAQLRILTAPASRDTHEGAAQALSPWVAAGRLVSWCAASQLFGIRHEAALERPPPEDLLPEALTAWCAPWWNAPAPTYGPDGDALVQALQLGHTSRRAPVLTAADTLPGGVNGRHWRKVRAEATRRIRRQVGALLVLGGVLAVLGSPLFLTLPSHPTSGIENDAPGSSGEASGTARRALEAPYPRGPHAAQIATPREQTTAYAGLRRVGPIVLETFAALDDSASLRDPHHRILRDARGRVERIEHYGFIGTLLGYEVFHWEDQDTLTRWLWFDAWGNPLRYLAIDPTLRTAQSHLNETPSIASHCTLQLRGSDDVQGWDDVVCLNPAGNPTAMAGGHHAETRVWSQESTGWRETVTYTREHGDTSTHQGPHVRIRDFDSAGRMRTEHWRDEQGTAVMHPELGASIVEVTRENGTVRTRLLDTDGAPTIGRLGWHERIWAPAPGGRGGEISFLDAHGQRTPLLGTEVAGWSERWTGGWPTLRVFLGEHRTPVTDAEFVHRRTWVRDDRGAPLLECADGLEGAVTLTRWQGGHCIARLQDDQGRIAELRFYDRHRQPRTDGGLARVRFGYDTHGRMHAIGYERGDNAQDGPIRGSWRRHWFFNALGLPTEEFWFSGTDEDLYQTPEWHVFRRFNDRHHWDHVQAFPYRTTRGSNAPERSDWLDVRRLGVETHQVLWEIESGSLLKWFGVWSRYLRMGRATVIFDLDAGGLLLRTQARSEGVGAGPAWPRQGVCHLPSECPDPQGLGAWYPPTLEDTLLHQRWPGELPPPPPRPPDSRELPERRVLPAAAHVPSDPW